MLITEMQIEIDYDVPKIKLGGHQNEFIYY